MNFPLPAFTVKKEDLLTFNVYFNWEATSGFGQFHISKNKDGNITCSNECMSREAVRAALHAAVDAAVDNAILRD